MLELASKITFSVDELFKSKIFEIDIEPYEINICFLTIYNDEKADLNKLINSIIKDYYIRIKHKKDFDLFNLYSGKKLIIPLYYNE